MARDLLLTAVYEEVEQGWTQARIAEIPAVITAAPNRAEAKDLLEDALREYLASFLEDGLEATDFGDREPMVLELTSGSSDT